MPRSSAYGLPCSIHHKRLSTGRMVFVARADAPAAPGRSRRRIKAQGRDLPQTIARLILNLRKANAEVAAQDLLDAAATQFGPGFIDRVDAAVPVAGPVVLDVLTDHLRRRYEGGHLKLASYNRGVGLVTNHIKPHAIARMPLLAVTTTDLRVFFDHLATKKNADGSLMLGPTPRRSIHGFFNQIFTHAEDQGLVTRSPMRGIDLPKKPSIKRDGAARKAGAVARVVSLIQEQLPYDDYLFVLPLLLGLRTSERLGLTHSALNQSEFNRIDLHVIRQLDRENYPAITPILKTDAAYRTLPLNALVRPHLDALYLRRALDRITKDQIDDSIDLDGRRSASGSLTTMLFDDDTVLFENTRGLPIRQQAATKKWNALRTRHLSDEPSFVEHDFRHIVATALVNDGFSDVVIDRYLGHSTDGRITHTYAHAGRDDLSKAALSLMRTFTRWPMPPTRLSATAVDFLRQYPEELPLSSLWRPMSKTEVAIGTYWNSKDQAPEDLDALLIDRHGVGLLDLAHSEAYLPPQFRHVTDDHVDWATRISPGLSGHRDWVTALVG